MENPSNVQKPSSSIIIDEIKEEISQKDDGEYRFFGLTFVRIAACVLVLGLVIFLRANNSYLFEKVCYWYENNAARESFTAGDLQKSGADFLKALYEKRKTNHL